jgi:hypothetical protein
MSGIAWTGDQDYKLMEAIEEMRVDNSIDWQQVALKVGAGRNDNACRSRFNALTEKIKAKLEKEAELF